MRLARSVGGRNTSGCGFAISAVFGEDFAPLAPTIAPKILIRTCLEMALPRPRGSYRPRSWNSFATLINFRVIDNRHPHARRIPLLVDDRKHTIGFHENRTQRPLPLRQR